jgi:integrase
MRRKFQEKKQWSHRLAASRYPGVFIMEEGGCIVRARVRDPWKQKVKGVKWSGYTEIKRVFRDKTEAEASAWLSEERQRISNRPSAQKHELLFARFAASVLKKKIDRKDLVPEKIDNWKNHLEHLISGTTSKDKTVQVVGFGNLLVTEITNRHVEDWKTGVSKLIFEKGDYKPGYTNGWLSTLKVVLRAAKKQFGLTHDAVADVKQFSMAEHSTYSYEEPNSLTLKQLGAFLKFLRETYPQHYALAKFGFATGIRPVNLSPLRRRPDETGAADINWETGLCFIRRGYGRKKQMRNTTKQRENYPITLPPSLLVDLEWHAKTQLKEGPQRDSPYLFPAETGGPRQASVLNKPFAEASKAIGLSYGLSLRGMRRMFSWMMENGGARRESDAVDHRAQDRQDAGPLHLQGRRDAPARDRRGHGHARRALAEVGGRVTRAVSNGLHRRSGGASEIRISKAPPGAPEMYPQRPVKASGWCQGGGAIAFAATRPNRNTPNLLNF